MCGWDMSVVRISVYSFVDVQRNPDQCLGMIVRNETRPRSYLMCELSAINDTKQFLAFGDKALLP